MNTRIRYADQAVSAEPGGPLVRLFRVLILLGVWILVGLAAVAAWMHLAR